MLITIFKIIVEKFGSIGFSDYLALHMNAETNIVNFRYPQKKSVKLTKEQVRDLRKRIKEFPTQTAASVGLGVGREVLTFTLMRGTCSPATYQKLFNKG